jgi:hypothetical protein
MRRKFIGLLLLKDIGILGVLKGNVDRGFDSGGDAYGVD